ncbi:hypothetical protein BDY21DRAFT_407070 [Lineolata rhizophorae]|uniref:Tat pathway signal sequence n=1 Tax=Lineolata rhizophorae TaxID=578093 RepID=A0A6A6NKX6_9PEZI|nr:hypothetical protein BDY21DRAFT_407070 [Lineolata rhizophorae]
MSHRRSVSWADRTHDEFLNQPSPYYDKASEEPFTFPAQSTESIWSQFVAKIWSLFKPKQRYVNFAPLPIRQDAHASEVYEKPVAALSEDGTPRTWLLTTRWTFALFAVLIVSLSFNLAFWLKSVSDPWSVQTHVEVLTSNASYTNTYHEYDLLWTEVLGGSLGEVYTSEGRDDGLTRKAGISMFHQLHCLAGIRSAIQQLQEGKEIGFSEETDTSEHRGHWPHCFDYLRQVLLCHADDSVELSQLESGQWRISGYRNKRICRDHKKLYEETKCGPQGCPGGKYFVPGEDFSKIKVAEESDRRGYVDEREHVGRGEYSVEPDKDGQ